MSRAYVESVWKSFKKQIINGDNLSALEDLVKILCKFKEHRKLLPQGSHIEFYRARFGDYVNKDDKEMGAPPEELAGEGRCNPKGVSYLYLAMDYRTACLEVTINGEYVYDSPITIAKYEVDVSNIFSFRAYATDLKYSLPIEDDDAKCLIELIDRDMGKRITNKCEYKPLQFIAQFIHALGYDGLLYSSTTFPGAGANLVMFNWKDNTVLREKFISSITFKPSNI